MVNGKSVIEVGSYNVNGSLRSFIESLEPKEYLGVDIELGPGVDQICKAEDLVERFGKNRFDVVISTEMVEHVKRWQEVIYNLKEITKPGGLMLVTTRSEGFPLHGYPFDYWRYEISDMKAIFSDFEMQVLEKDSDDPGVLLFAKKPHSFKEKNLKSHRLFSILVGKRVATSSLDALLWVEKARKASSKMFTGLGRAFLRIKHYVRHPFGLPGMVRRKLGGPRHNIDK